MCSRLSCRATPLLGALIVLLYNQSQGGLLLTIAVVFCCTNYNHLLPKTIHGHFYLNMEG